MIKKREEKKKKKHRCWAQHRYPANPPLCAEFAWPPAPGVSTACFWFLEFSQCSHYHSSHEGQASFSMAITPQHNTAAVSLRPHLASPKDWTRVAEVGFRKRQAPPDLGGKGEMLGDPRSSFAYCHYFTTWGRSPPFRKGKKESLKKLMKILEGGTKDLVRSGCKKKKKKKAQSSSLGFGIKKRAVWVLEEICKESYCFHSFLSGNNNHNRISRSAMIVCV